jgi:hypothetical protein
MTWTDPRCADLDARAAADMRHRSGWHKQTASPCVSAGPETAKGKRLERIAARMRAKYLRTGKGCVTRRRIVEKRT